MDGVTGPTVLDYRKFRSLQGLELCTYMEPFVSDDKYAVPEQVLQRILSELPKYDQYHLVYALLLGAKQQPRTVLPELPGYLAHPETSVRCAAVNILDGLPEELVTKDLLDKLREVAGSPLAAQLASGVVARFERVLATSRPGGADEKQ